MKPAKRGRGSGSKENVGRKALLSKIKPVHHYAALLLALGKRQIEVANAINMSYESVRKWQEFEQFNDLIADYRKIFIQKVLDEGFDDLQFLTNTMIESLKSPAHRSDGLRARELLAKIRGEFSPEEFTLKVKEELKNLSDKDLTKLAKEQNENIPSLNSTRNRKAEKPGGKDKVQE